MDLQTLTQVAIKAARAAGKHIQEQLHQKVVVEEKSSAESYAAQVVTAVDRACEAIILEYLQPTCPAYDLGLLSEETEDDRSRFEKDYFWCIDPMDGTLAFINKEPGFSVSIALIAKTGEPLIGVVYDPSTDTLYHATKGSGVFKNGLPWEIHNTNSYLTYVTDKKLVDTPQAYEIERILAAQMEKAKLTGIEQLSGGGSVLNAIRVLENGPACMIKLPKKAKGGGSIWDFAATACIFQELGLRATTFEGGPLALNREGDTFMNAEGVWYGNFLGE